MMILICEIVLLVGFTRTGLQHQTKAYGRIRGSAGAGSASGRDSGAFEIGVPFQ